MDNARTRYLKLDSCIRCGSIQNAPAQLITDLDKQMYACAIDNDTYNDELVVYTVSGSTPYAANWLSLTDGGSALTPATGVLYIVSSSGIYKDKIYRWTGSSYLLLGGGAQAFNVTITADDNTTILIKNQLEQTITTTANFGDTLTITATAGTGYTLSTLLVNGEAFTSGETIIVTGHMTVSATSAINTYNLSISETNCAITVMDGETEIEAGTGVITHGHILTITAVANETFTMDTLTVNATPFTSGETHTVAGNIAIVGTAI